MKTWEQKWKNDAPPMDEETEDALLKLLQGEDDDPSSSLSSGAQKKHCDPTDDSATIDGGVQGGEARQMKGVSQSQVSPVTTSERRKWDGNAEGVPAAKRTKTEAENGESDSDSEFVYEHKMMRLRRAAELRKEEQEKRWWDTAEYRKAEKEQLWDKVNETTDFIDFSCYLEQDYSKGMLAVTDKAFRFVMDVTTGREYKVRP